jgi:hypothetical protein
LIPSPIALHLDDIYVIAHAAAEYVETLPAVYVDDFKIVVGASRDPALIRATVPGKLLNVRAVTAAVSEHVENETAIRIANGKLSVAKLDEFPTLICVTIAGVLLDVGALAGAAAEDVDTFPAINVAEQTPVLRTTLEHDLSR